MAVRNLPRRRGARLHRAAAPEGVSLALRWLQYRLQCRSAKEGVPMPQTLSFDVELPLPFNDAVSRVKDALKQEGFGILTEIDLRAAFLEKLGREFRPYVILGACNPPLAFAAVNADPAIGLLLPCNVTVESAGEQRTIVRLTNPEAMLATATGASAELGEVARDAGERMTRVTAALNQR
jgi:uncharacterized protein (DUF302 family)